MKSALGHTFDFFLSRRGSVAAIAREVTDVLTEKGYKVLVQDYDIPLGASFVVSAGGSARPNLGLRRWDDPSGLVGTEPGSGLSSS